MNFKTATLDTWVKTKLKSLNNIQQQSIPSIEQRKNTLIISPTGSGKTLAAFLSIIDYLLDLQEKQHLQDHVYCLYISPLKALNNDIRKNLETPLNEMKLLANHEIKLRVAVRTGDTPQKERAKMLALPPHILITTPESLGILLSTPKFSKHLHSLEFVIVDEIHSLIQSKRGTFLAGLLERLQDLAPSMCRIGLSATVSPIQEVALYLSGYTDQGAPRPMNIINHGTRRQLNLTVKLPGINLIQSSYEQILGSIGKDLVQEIINSRTSLCFANTRNGAERFGHYLKQYFGEEKIGVHHGSMEKKERLTIEDLLKQGKLKAVVTSSSLELGIDIGSIDKVIQIGSPKKVSTLLQRIGRSGHHQTKISKGVLYPLDKEDFLETLVLVNQAKKGEIEPVIIPKLCLDVLAQLLVGMAITKIMDVKTALRIIKRSSPYRELTETAIIKVLRSLSKGVGENHWKYARIWFDENTKQFGKKRSSRAIYYQNIGTIPDVASYDVILKDSRKKIGELDGSFAELLNPEDTFILGGKTYSVIRLIGNKVLVQLNPLGIPNIPSWYGEALARPLTTSKALCHLLNQVEEYWKKIMAFSTKKQSRGFFLLGN